MFVVMSPPSNPFKMDLPQQHQSSLFPAFRPAVPSPLTSSPIRSSPPRPLSPLDRNIVSQRDIQSSPGFAPPPKFKYASRPSRPNPVIQRREDKQETRRRLFLQNVRQRTEDRRWQRRGGDQETLKMEWVEQERKRRLQKEHDADASFNSDYIDEADDIEQGRIVLSQGGDDDMVETLAMDEEGEIDALFSSYHQYERSRCAQPNGLLQSPPSTFDDDEDYDTLFMDLIAHENGASQRGEDAMMDIS